MLEVGFAKSASPLSYTFVERLEKPNEHMDYETMFLEKERSGLFTIALSFNAQSPRGVLLGTDRTHRSNQPVTVSTSYV